jgi:hypothetical protein
MKLQVGYEQFAALSLFVFSVTFLISQLFSYYPAYINEARRQTLFSEAFQVSELLVNDVGEPANWYAIPLSNVKRIGLLNESLNRTNVVSIIKVSRANATCNSNYAQFKQLLDLKNDVNFVVYLEGSLIANCSRPLGEKAVKISRMISFDNKSYGELVIWVY